MDENAAKALLMAGGILIAIIIISIFILSYSNVTQLQQANIDTKTLREIEEFNKAFVSYNKNAMYGTDVISILNMAISNNNVRRVTENEEYYVDIRFKLTNEAITQEIETFELQDNGSYQPTDYEKNEIFSVGVFYSVSDNHDSIKDFLATAENDGEKKVMINSDDYSMVSYPINDFKEKIFKCSKVEYDQYGRVKLMVFEQYA